MTTEHTPTVLDEMRTAFAMRHWHKTDDFKAGQRIFDDQIATIEAAAEQRGATKALRTAASDYALYADSHALDGEPVDYLNDRADRIAIQDGQDRAPAAPIPATAIIPHQDQ